MKQTNQKRFNYLVAIALLLFAAYALLGATGCAEQVDEGYRGIRKSWGKVQGDPLPPGLYFYMPIAGNVFEMSVREDKWTAEEQVFTKDTQAVTVALSLTVYPKPEKIAAIYSQFGEGWEQKILAPVMQSSIKDAIGQYNADDLIGRREAVRDAAFKEIVKVMAARDVVVTRLDITNLDFSDEYEAAVDMKVKAVQQALEAKNRTVQVEEQAKQKILTAEADAKAMRIKSEALRENKGLTAYQAVEKWNGVLPVNMYGSAPIPFLNLKGE